MSACITADSLEALAERLAYEKGRGEESKYAPYIDVLPSLDNANDDSGGSLLSLPRFWDIKRLEKITDGGQLEARIMKDKRDNLDPWALACVDSRANFLGEGGYSMTPILDMINHDSSVPTKARLDKNKGFAGEGDVLYLTSGKSYHKGDEAFISYGNLNNLDTLADYGFVMESNPCNVESVTVRMMRREPFQGKIWY